MVDGSAKTPRYVLNEGLSPTRPRVSHARTDIHENIIYGFSDKPQYDVYITASHLALTPYPLVRGFLENQIKLDGDSLRLVVLDAASVTQQFVYAATFSSVIESLLRSSDSVAVTHRLILDGSGVEYRIETCSF